MSATGDRIFPPDQDIVHQWVYFSAGGYWARQRGGRHGRTLVDVSGSQVEIAGTNSGDDTRVIFAEELGVSGIEGNAIGVVTYGDGALESVGATEFRSKLYAEDEGQNLHAVNAETLGSGITSGAAGVNTYADRALESVGLDEMRTHNQSRRGGTVTLQDPGANISGGNAVSGTILPNDRFSLYLSAAGSAAVDVGLSPNGDDFFRDRTIGLTSAGEHVENFTAATTAIRLEARTSAAIRAFVREII